MNHFRLVIAFAVLATGCSKPADIPAESKLSGLATSSKPSENLLTESGSNKPGDTASEAKSTGKSEPLTSLMEKQSAAASAAIKALGRVEAAVQVGVNYQRYSELVIDGKAELNDAARILPAAELLTNLSDAMDAYRDAGMVWGHHIRYSPLGLRGFPHGDIITRYKLNVTGKASEAEAAMQLMWRVASEKLSAARALQ